MMVKKQNEKLQSFSQIFLDFQRVSDQQHYRNQSSLNNVTMAMLKVNQNKKDQIVKLKNQLLSSHLSPDIQKLYLQSQKIEIQQQTTRKRLQLRKRNRQHYYLFKRRSKQQKNNHLKAHLGDFITSFQVIFSLDHQLGEIFKLGIKVSKICLHIIRIKIMKMIQQALYLKEMEIKFLKNKNLYVKVNTVHNTLMTTMINL
ncbi:unnamed protein product (macronuclear) [Paramecium tetraurelia]|uniref:Transmembrane protein n=1 Tax=Paramecium tetraurelia TaxID=5888 RepID=A0DL22_PARTE|nr:uncharacterized protein GSPATT00018056001 [Paramecium tetraurelia]CAK83739.1 unnamed protein product [Paramecium tetraurelia]|eukprot:XP_001451136.1 hypothetical protein (macronuclear) [Paramecium tetraurelia strain d4-2]